MKVLWLASWYPSELSPFNGDFIQRHARAASLYNEIEVMYVVKDALGVVTKGVHKSVKSSTNLTETTIYYYSPLSGTVGKLISEWKYQKCFKEAVKDYIKREGKPDLVHVHVGMKSGTIARWIKKKYGIPFLLTEHWTGILPEAKPSLNDYPFYYQAAYKKTIRNAKAVSVVSNSLASQIKSFLERGEATLIPNVVDTDLFKPSSKEPQSVANFIHISGLDYQKNPEAIIDAFAILKGKGIDFQLYIYGPQPVSLQKRVFDLGLNAHVYFHKEIPQQELVKCIQNADALILYSRYETFGCVVIEAHACGVPVIASDIPVLREIVYENVNGLLVPANDATALAKSVIRFINNRRKFDKKIISDTATAYSYKKVGSAFDDWYKANSGK